jgi:hypothetical protein
MADNTLEAFQIGASLYDRAQTQKRMMDQLQLQTAQQLMQQKSADLQNKIQQNSFGQALKEQEAQDREFGAFQKYNEDVADYLNDPDKYSVIPAVPRFESKVYNQNATQASKGLSQFSNRAIAAKTLESVKNIADQADIQILTQAAKLGAFQLNEDGTSKRNERGVPLVDFKKLQEMQMQAAGIELLQKESVTGSKFTKESLSEALSKGTVTQSQYDKYLPFARPEGGIGEQRTQKNIQDLAAEGFDLSNPADVANATRVIRSNIKTPAKVIDSITASDKAIFQLDNAIEKINQFDALYGKGAFNEYVGPIDSPLFKATAKFKGLTSAEKQTARTIQQQIGMVIQDYRKGVFGATLTTNEQKNMDSISGTTGGNDYVLLTSGFNENLKRGIEKSITNNKFNADIPMDLKRTYAPRIFVGGATPATPSVGQPAGGVPLPAGWGFKQ